MLEGTIVQGRQVIFRLVIVTLDLHARVCVVQNEADEVEDKARYDYLPLVLAPYASEVTFGLFYFRDSSWTSLRRLIEGVPIVL